LILCLREIDGTPLQNELSLARNPLSHTSEANQRDFSNQRFTDAKPSTLSSQVLPAYRRSASSPIVAPHLMLSTKRMTAYRRNISRPIGETNFGLSSKHISPYPRATSRAICERADRLIIILSFWDSWYCFVGDSLIY
jgi:hypothetical protein